MEEPDEAASYRVLRELLLGPRNSGNQEVKIELKDIEGSRNRSERAWFAAGLSALLAGVAVWAAADAKAELRALRIEQENQLRALRTDQANELKAQRTEQLIMYNWIAQEVTAIRSYITTGKLAPMEPRPIGLPQQEKKK